MNKKVVLSFLCGAALATTACAMKEVSSDELEKMTHDDRLYSEAVYADCGKMQLHEAAREDRFHLGDHGETQLHEAARQDNFGLLVDMLRFYKADVWDKKGNAPLHYAAAHGNISMMKTLLDKGACVNAKNFHGATPLMSAANTFVKEYEEGVFTIVTSSGSGFYNFDDLRKAEEERQQRMVETVKLLVSKGALVNEHAWVKDVRHSSQEPSPVGMTALHLAICQGNISMVRCLLECGANPLLVNSDGWTALQYAKILASCKNEAHEKLARRCKKIAEMLEPEAVWMD